MKRWLSETSIPPKSTVVCMSKVFGQGVYDHFQVKAFAATGGAKTFDPIKTQWINVHGSQAAIVQLLAADHITADDPLDVNMDAMTSGPLWWPPPIFLRAYKCYDTTTADSSMISVYVEPSTGNVYADRWD